jgi:hypothetical protein
MLTETTTLPVIVTVSLALGLSQSFTVWETKYSVVPATSVETLGEAVEPVPPVAVVYHFRSLPLAVRSEGVAPWQYVTSVTAGAAGIALTVTDTAVLALSQPFTVCVTEYTYVPALSTAGVKESSVLTSRLLLSYHFRFVPAAVSVMVLPLQTGAGLVATGAAGTAGAVSVMVFKLKVHPASSFTVML